MPEINHQYRESAIQDMMGKPPGWLLNSGIMCIALVFLVALGLTSFIRYPEKVEAPFLLQTETIPLALHAGAMNVIDTVLTPNDAPVTAGDTLLVFRSEADWRSVRNLDHWLAQLEHDLYIRSQEKVGETSENLPHLQHLSRLSRLPSSGFYSPFGGRGAKSRELGVMRYPAQIQTPITTLQTILRAQASYLQTNGLSAETTAYKREIADANRLSKSLGRQVELYEQELGYQQSEVERMQKLGKDGIVSIREVEQAEAQTIGARRQREVLVSSDIQNQLRVQQLRQQILQRRLAHREQLADFERQLLVQLKLLRTALDEFRERYVLIARESGTLSWQPNVRAQATVSPADPIGYLLPADGDDKTVARLQLPSLGQGKISLGDKVILDFAAYPSREYGQVEGKLTALAPVALPNQQGEYLRLATVALPDTLLTSYGKTLPFRYNLSGTARVITAERSLLQRLLDQFLNLTKNT